MQYQSHRSRILQHSRNQQTDQLYTPLRQALIQSSIQKPPNSRLYRSATMFDLQVSQVSQRVRELDPVQAAYLIGSIYIPNSRLRATQNVGKIQDKKFIAIRVRSKQKGAISEQQFRNRQKLNGHKTQKTVYEIQPTQQTTNTMSNTMTPISYQFRPHNADRSQSLYYSSNTGERSGTNFNNSVRKVSQFTQSSMRKDDQVVEAEGNQYGLQYRPASQMKQHQLRNTVYNNLNNNIDRQSQNEQQVKSTHMNSRSQKSITSYISGQGQPLTKQQQLSNLSKFTIPNPNYNKPSKEPSPNPFHPSNIITNAQHLTGNNTNTDSSCTSNGNSRQPSNAGNSKKRRLQIASKGEKNKYNLFSALDYAVNSGCGGCGSNQVIATKQQHEWS